MRGTEGSREACLGVMHIVQVAALGFCDMTEVTFSSEVLEFKNLPHVLFYFF